MITSIRYLDNKAILNNCVKVWFENGEVKSSYDKSKISLEDSLVIINEYLANIKSPVKSVIIES
jgi:hypothetical protein